MPRHVEGELANWPPAKAFMARGLRCRAVAVMGMVWVVMGLGVLTGASQLPEDILFSRLPSQARAALWIGPGIAAMATGWIQVGTSRVLGWMIIMPAVRLASYLAAWLAYLLPWSTAIFGEYPHGWFVASTYTAMIAAVAMAGAIPEHFHPGATPHPSRSEAPDA